MFLKAWCIISGQVEAWRPNFFIVQYLIEMHHDGERHAEHKLVQKLHAEFTASVQAENSSSHRRGQRNRNRRGSQSVTQLQSGQQQNTHLWYAYCTHASNRYQLQQLSRAGPGKGCWQHPHISARLEGRQAGGGGQLVWPVIYIATFLPGTWHMLSDKTH